ncbi:acid-sensing ion channel 2-like [Patiria miniata]|uniref:Acid-sensing ion channel 1-like n=1 Tax=Patiria miniata TaxID=46514 RepID=A0A913ZVS2_PATMI|nr:acid-sensing ion channel 2-like [Patiria miniata]
MRVEQLAKKIGRVRPEDCHADVIPLPGEVLNQTSGTEAPREVFSEVTNGEATKTRQQTWEVGYKMSTDEKRRGSQGASLRLKTALKDETSVVGIKNVVDDKVQTGRKVMWLCLLLAGLGMVTYQIAKSITYFQSWPVMVNVEVVYPDDLIEFPSVTICNFNMFKKSAVEMYGPEFVEFINLAYPVGMMNSNQTQPDFMKFNDFDLNQFYMDTGHLKEDMILECSWQGQPCGHDDFISILTDFGMCHTFNSRTKGMAVRRIKHRGSRFGLRLRLNVETDQYMPGPRDSVGVKVSLHHQDDIPKGMAKDLGFALSPGTYNLAEVSMSKIKNQPHPYGKCGSKQLKHVEMYSVMACILDCQADYVIKMCRCKDAFMPGDVLVCSPHQLQTCLNPQMEMFISSFESNCACPVPCERTMYSTMLSSGIFPARHVAMAMDKEFNMSMDYSRNNLLELMVYFEELKYTQITQQPAYTLEGLLSDIGGSMGLFMGVSILTIFELMDVFRKAFY